MLPIPCILLVDDDETTRYLMRRRLDELCASGKLEILEAADGAQALTLVQARTTSATCGGLLILLDLNMPVMDGLEFMQRLRRLPPASRQSVAVVAVSATTNPAERASATELADSFREKPLTEKVLAALLRQYLPGIMAATDR